MRIPGKGRIGPLQWRTGSGVRPHDSNGRGTQRVRVQWHAACAVQSSRALEHATRHDASPKRSRTRVMVLYSWARSGPRLQRAEERAKEKPFGGCLQKPVFSSLHKFRPLSCPTPTKLLPVDGCSGSPFNLSLNARSVRGAPSQHTTPKPTPAQGRKVHNTDPSHSTLQLLSGHEWGGTQRMPKIRLRCNHA
jgi:hypothetical protein